jgi:hypothetical protein
MKWALITANVLAAAALIFLGYWAVSWHHMTGYSVYRELQERGVLRERADYSVEERVRTVGGGGANYFMLSLLGAGACLVNAIAIGIWFPKPKSDAVIAPEKQRT